MSCAFQAVLPEQPEVIQYGVHANVEPPGFYGVNNKTEAHTYRPFQHPDMKAAQCLSADDYKKEEEWLSAVEQIALDRCR